MSGALGTHMEIVMTTKGKLGVALVIGVVGMAVSTAWSAGAGAVGTDQRIVARTYNNIAANKAAGFPTTALNVNRDQYGRMSWMMTPQEIRSRNNFEKQYLAPARKLVAASVTEGRGKVSASLFGVTGTSTLVVSGASLVPENQAVTYDRDSQSGNLVCGLGVLEDDFLAQIDLPSGALITGMTVYGNDSSLLNDPSFSVYQHCNTGAGPQLVGMPVFASVTAGFTGGAFAVSSATISHTVDNTDCAYTFVADFAGALTCDAGTGMHMVAIRWKRQISPAPATESFADVPTENPFHGEVEALLASGITAGCGGGNYCPDQPVTRGQMAAFLSRALGLHWE